MGYEGREMVEESNSHFGRDYFYIGILSIYRQRMSKFIHT